jgi:hypothetical protein
MVKRKNLAVTGAIFDNNAYFTRFFHFNAPIRLLMAKMRAKTASGQLFR